MAQLTVKAIQAAKAKAERYELSDGGGLSLRVAPNGSKNWYVRYSLDGKQRPAPLRPYGDVPGTTTHYTLAEAREKAASVRALARKGIDFKEDDDRKERDAIAQQQRAQGAENLRTVRDLFAAWFPTVATKRGNKGRKDGGAEIQRVYEKFVFGPIGDTPLVNLYASHVRPIITAISDAGNNRQAVVLLGDIKQMFRWGEKNQPWKRLLVDSDILAIEPEDIVSNGYNPRKDNERHRSLSEDEIAALARIVPAAALELSVTSAIWIMLACGTRVGETVSSRWEHIDLERGTWFIPGEATKTASAITITLSDFARAKFAALWAAREALPPSQRSPFAFPARNETHMNKTTIANAIRARQVDKQYHAKSTPLFASLKLSGGVWKCHDLRRTCATIMQALGVPESVAHRCLNHARSDALDRIYLRHDYAAEMADAWRKLGERLDALTAAANDRNAVVAVNA